MKKTKVLIVDDNATIRDALHRVLSIFPDIEVIGSASNGKEAIEKTVKLSPQVVLMDLQMPEMDGIEATRIINQKCPETAIIMLTLYQELLLEAELEDLKVNGYVLKEGGAEKIYQAIKEAVKVAF